MTMDSANSVASKIIIDAQKSSKFGNLIELWNYRELLFFLTWRQVKVRYKQSVLGILWIVIQPLFSTLVMTIVFNVFLKVPSSGDIPYPIFIMTALIYWKYFSSALQSSSQSLVANSPLVGKVYFPRLIIPLSSLLSPLVDFAISLIVLLIAMPIFGIMPTWKILLIPVLAVYTIVATFSVSLWLSALNVRYRDIAYVIPFVLQIWMYLSPIIYPMEQIPERFRTLYSINPMVVVIEGARWALLGAEYPITDNIGLIIGSIGIVFLLFFGVIFFNRIEQTFADVI